jgi:hypothetical protein
MSEFGVFSGIQQIVARVCPSTNFWQQGISEPQKFDEYVANHPYNQDAIMVFYNAAATAREIKDPQHCINLQRMERQLDLPSLRASKITHVIAGQPISLPHLRKVAVVKGIHCYEVVKFL